MQESLLQELSLPEIPGLEEVERIQELHVDEVEQVEQIEQEVLTIELVGERFKEWRSKKTNKDRIPQELWKQAVDLTAQRSISEVCKNLGLGFSYLKKHVLAKSDNLKDLVSDSPYPTKETGEDFLEVKLDRANPMSTLPNLSMFGVSTPTSDLVRSSCLMELSKPDGSTLRVYSNTAVEQMERIDINRICEAFIKS